MTYKKGFLMAILFHIALILVLTQIQWPHADKKNKIGSHKTVLIESYIFAPTEKNTESKTKTKTKTKLQTKQQKQLQSDKKSVYLHHKGLPIPLQTDQTKLHIPKKLIEPQKSQLSHNIQNHKSAQLSKGQYNRLLELLHNAIAENQLYPENAQLLNQHGSVLLHFEILATGKIIHIVIEKSSGYPLLDQAAKNAVKSVSPFDQVKLSHSIAMQVSVDFKS